MATREETFIPGAGFAPVVPATEKVNGLKPVDDTQGFTQADLFLLLCVSIWGFNVPLVKVVLNYLDPLAVSVIRFGIAGVIFAVITLFRERSLAIQWRHLGLIVTCAMFGIALNQIFFVYALKNTTSSEVSLLMSCTATFAALVSWVLGYGKIGRSFWLSLPISFCGVALIVLTAPGARLSGSWLGDGLAIFMAATWATYTVLLRPLMQFYSITKISAYVSLIGVAAMLPFSFEQLDGAKLAAVPSDKWLILVFCTLGAVVFTNVLWYTGIKRLGASRTAFYGYFQPFIGVVAAFLILHEGLVIWQILGGVLIIAGLLIYRLKK